MGTADLPVGETCSGMRAINTRVLSIGFFDEIAVLDSSFIVMSYRLIR
jgi:hypothetical protein